MHTLTKLQFDVLTALEGNGKAGSRQEIAVKTGLDATAIMTALDELGALGYLNDLAITDKGLLALEPYRVQRAVILAAGFGHRLVPVTLNTPKPLVRVKGERIIDSLLDALAEADIRDVVIVRGYLSEQFDQLLYKYPYIKFIENPIYNESNNISSLMCARYYLKNAYICEADLLIRNKAVIRKYQYCTNFLGVPVDRTDDWCFTTGDDGYITSLTIGGVDCHHVYGISYWDGQDGAKLAEHVKAAYNQPGGKERLWDMVPFEYFAGEYKVSVRECAMEDIVEIDTYNELKQLDSVYR